MCNRWPTEKVLNMQKDTCFVQVYGIVSVKKDWRFHDGIQGSHSQRSIVQLWELLCSTSGTTGKQQQCIDIPVSSHDIKLLSLLTVSIHQWIKQLRKNLQNQVRFPPYN